MMACLFHRPGLENLTIADIPLPEFNDNEVLVEVRMAGVNPVDSFAVKGTRPVKPIPHVPGAEFAGIVRETGSKVEHVRKGDYVIVYPRIFDSMCDTCLQGKEMLCRNGGIIGIVTNGGFAEYAAVPSKNVFKVDENMSWELAASIPVSALTAYHALVQSRLVWNDLVVVVGASGNTGMFAVQFAKMMGARVVGISRKEWVRDYGADLVVDLDHAFEKINEFSMGRMADVVLDSLGAKTFGRSFQLLGVSGRMVTFGALTGGDVTLSISSLYNKSIKIIGTTGGTRKEMVDIINNSSRLKVRVWKKFNLEDVRTAIESLSAEGRDGRIFLDLQT